MTGDDWEWWEVLGYIQLRIKRKAINKLIMGNTDVASNHVTVVIEH